MEIVDKFDNKRELLNKTAQRHEKIKGEYRQSAHIWIVNKECKFLMQKRSKYKKSFAGKWSQTGGAVAEGETPLQGALRECKEELGLDIPKKEIELIFSFKREYDFVDVWLVRKNIDIKKLKLQEEEVEEVKWVSKEELEKMIKNNETTPNVSFYFNMLIKLIKEYC